MLFVRSESPPRAFHILLLSLAVFLSQLIFSTLPIGKFGEAHHLC